MENFFLPDFALKKSIAQKFSFKKKKISLL